MEAYTERPAESNTVAAHTDLTGKWTLRRRTQWCATNNPNHRGLSHTKRRRRLEREHERMQKFREPLLSQVRAELSQEPDDEQLKTWAMELATWTPAAIGAIYDPAAIGPGGGKRSWWYLPDNALERASLFIRLMKKVMQYCKYIGRRRILDRLRGVVDVIAVALRKGRPPELAAPRRRFDAPGVNFRAGRLPHMLPPRTPRENQEVKDSSFTGLSRENFWAAIEKARAAQPPGYVPPTQEAR